MKSSGTADLPLMGGAIPAWLFERMCKLSLAVVESILMEKGHADFVRRMSDPFWFQSFGAVIGMDWNSSGVTTAIMRALRKSINPHGKELGIYICGGKGKQSLKTPQELIRVGDATGLDGHALAQASKLSAKVDNTAIQDGFQLYLHNFIVTEQGHWTVIQQGMDGKSAMARRYHWHSDELRSFVDQPHTAICGEHQGEILDLTNHEALAARNQILALSHEKPEVLMREARHLTLPTYKDLKPKDINFKRLGAILSVAQDQDVSSFEDLLLLKGMGPRALQSLALVSEVIHATPTRFSDPARFAFAHGGKSAKPFPVPTKIYDETIQTLRSGIERAKLGQSDKKDAIKKLSQLTRKAEEEFTLVDDPEAAFHRKVREENRNSWKYGGRRVSGFVKPDEGQQLNLFD